MYYNISYSPYYQPVNYKVLPVLGVPQLKKLNYIDSSKLEKYEETIKKLKEDKEELEKKLLSRATVKTTTKQNINLDELKKDYEDKMSSINTYIIKIKGSYEKEVVRLRDLNRKLTSKLSKKNLHHLMENNPSREFISFNEKIYDYLTKKNI